MCRISALRIGAEEKVFSWQAEADLLLVDNMLVAHARNPYVGNRSVLVCMGELQTWSTVRVGAAAFRV